MRINRYKLKLAMARKQVPNVRELAKLIGISYQGLYDAIRNGRTNNMSLIGKLAEALGVDVIEIVVAEAEDAK